VPRPARDLDDVEQVEFSELRDCRLNGGTGWSEIRKESDHD
jgi:hypothetical protein